MDPSAPALVLPSLGGSSSPRPTVPLVDIAVADWSNFVHRAFHGLGARTDLLSGDICQCALGMILDICRQAMYTGGKVAYVLDGGLSGRRELFGEYKNNRTEEPDRAPALVHALTGAWLEQTEVGTFVRVHGYESDDVMAALVRHHTALNPGMGFILSNDGDMLQCVSDQIRILKPRGGEEPPEVTGPEEFWEAYGFHPSRFVHYKALKGDAGDAIPGVYKVGHGIAKKLIAERGNIASVYHGALMGAFTDKLTTNLLAARAQVYLNLKLVTLVPVPGIEAIYSEVLTGRSPIY